MVIVIEKIEDYLNPVGIVKEKGKHLEPETWTTSNDSS